MLLLSRGVRSVNAVDLIGASDESSGEGVVEALGLDGELDGVVEAAADDATGHDLLVLLGGGRSLRLALLTKLLALATTSLTLLTTLCFLLSSQFGRSISLAEGIVLFLIVVALGVVVTTIISVIAKLILTSGGRRRIEGDAGSVGVGLSLFVVDVEITEQRVAGSLGDGFSGNDDRRSDVSETLADPLEPLFRSHGELLHDGLELTFAARRCRFVRFLDVVSGSGRSGDDGDGGEWREGLLDDLLLLLGGRVVLGRGLLRLLLGLGLDLDVVLEIDLGRELRWQRDLAAEAEDGGRWADQPARRLVSLPDGESGEESEVVFE